MLKPLFAATVAFASSSIGAIATLIFGWPGAIIATIALCSTAFLLFNRKTAPSLPDESEKNVVPPRTEAPKVEAAPIPEDRTDPLTGLANANGLAAWFAEKSERLAADGKGIVVLLAHLEDFQPLIRARGQAVADAVLLEVASRVAVVAGAEGIAARTDGEEFAAVVSVVPDHSEAVAAERAGQLIEMIGRPVEHASGAIWIGGCVGAAAGLPTDREGTLARARSALTAAVRKGRGQCVVFGKNGGVINTD